MFWGLESIGDIRLGSIDLPPMQAIKTDLPGMIILGETREGLKKPPTGIRLSFVDDDV